MEPAVPPAQAKDQSGGTMTSPTGSDNTGGAGERNINNSSTSDIGKHTHTHDMNIILLRK